ncbi:hypothetical protein D3C73_1343130 [compost metagenome]
MCAADVSFSPSAMNRNSRPNKPPASNPPRQVLPTCPQPPRQQIIKPTSTAARPLRSAACITGAISTAADLISTCWQPQIRHSPSMTWKAKASGFLRAALMGGPLG